MPASVIREEMKKVCDETEISRPTVKETLQSIDSTLKRIEKLISKESTVKIITEGVADQLVESLEKTMNQGMESER